MTHLAEILNGKEYDEITEPENMKIHRELQVQCREPDLDALGQAIQSHLPVGWERDEQAERSLKNEIYYCFTSISRPGLSKAQVWITYSSEKQVAWVANIVPKSTPSLDIEEYNRIIADLYTSAIKTAADQLNFAASLTDEDVDATHWGVSERTIGLLKSFSVLANKATGSSHPRDRERWYDFLIAVHRDGADLDVTSLGQMLVESYGWSPSISTELRLEYEFALGLLKRYDESGR